MLKFFNLQPERVFHFFEEISAIPRGSTNMGKIAAYCEDFAVKNGLEYVRDSADNVIIYKPASKGCEKAQPIILQGHLDMVCQKTEDSSIDFDNDGLDIYVDGDFIKARGTTLGADNGIAVSMILAILENRELVHPAIEAVLTTDEEIGMIGAGKLDMSLLKSKKMINLDSEEEQVMTVSCAGGSDFTATVKNEGQIKQATKVTVVLKGLLGGHSGVEIDKGRVNSNILAGRFLNRMKSVCPFDIVAVVGGSKANAIANMTEIILCTDSPEKLKREAEEYLSLVKNEISAREGGFEFSVTVNEKGSFNALSDELKEKIIFALTCAPNGVIDMSAEIENLVETSLNLGILKVDGEKIFFHFALRSNKKSALEFLDEKMTAFFTMLGFETDSFSHYPPWEFKNDSDLQQLYKSAFKEQFGFGVKAQAIHAGLECGIFASAIDRIDCIAIGPEMHDVHTVNERLSIKSTERIYKLLIKILEKST